MTGAEHRAPDRPGTRADALAVNTAVRHVNLQPPIRRNEVLAFLDRVSLPEGHFLEIRSIVPDSRGASSTFCSSMADAVDVAARSSGRANVYFGVCPRSKPSGDKSAVTIVPCAWADLDFRDIDSDRRRAEHVAHDRLRSFGCRPTVLVHSGNGFQALWYYTELVPISAEWPAERFEAINRGLAHALGGDAVHDLARVLRVPGTVNLPDAKKQARGCVPVMARLLWADGPSYPPDSLAVLQVDTEPTRCRTTPSPQRPGLHPEPDPDVIDAFIRSLDTFEPGHPLVRTWYGKRDLVDDSRSGWDMALANQLVRAGVRDEYIAMILRSFPLGRGPEATESYLDRTIAKARDAAGSAW